MRDNSEFKIAWLLINLRWFFLLAVASVIGLDVLLQETTFPSTVLVLLVVGGIANMMALIALLQNTANRTIHNLMLLHDIVLTLGFIAASQGMQSPLIFVSLIPITAAAMRISWLFSILLNFGVVIAYWIIAWNYHDLAMSAEPLEILGTFAPYIANGIILVLAGTAVSRIGVRIKQVVLSQRAEREQEAQVALKMAHQKAQLIFRLASTLSATLNYERVLEAALDVSNAGLREFVSNGRSGEITQVGMILLYSMDQTLYVAKSRGMVSSDEQVRFPAQEGILAAAIERAEPMITDAPAEDPELQNVLALQKCQQAIIVPLRAGFESYGFLLLASTEPDIYTTDFRDLLIAICNQAVLALQNASLYQNLMDEKDRLVTVEEDARKKLARDLHDGPTQTIAAIAMRLNYIRLLVDKDPGEALDELGQLEDLARRTTKEIRQMLFTLRPLILESQGLIAAIQQLKQKIGETDPLPIHLEADPAVERLLNKEAKGAIFYILEEATTNVRKHAEADNVWIRIYRRGMNVIAEVEDDGKGFDVAALESNYASRGSLGMINLRERAVLVKGKTVIRSTPGKGTTITVTVPVAVAEAEAS